MKAPKRLTIGYVAKLAGVGIETLRYYERVGMIARPERVATSFREYSRETVVRVKFIKRAQELGFSLKEISELLSLRGSGSCLQVGRRADRKLAEVRGKIADLRDIERALESVRKGCSGQSASSNCALLEKFWNDEDRALVL